LTNKHEQSIDREAAKLVVIGWDAATWDLLTPWLEAGDLPNLAGLMERGSYGALRSTALPLSPAAWSTIITGQNPAKHGVFDWFQRKPGSYGVEYVHSGQILSKPIWKYFNEGGKSIGVFNLPMIYPAVPIEGFMVAGMAAPSAQVPGLTYPDDLLGIIEDKVGPYFVAEREVYKYGREEPYLQNMLTWLDYQKKVVLFLIERQPCDSYLLVFMQSDHAQHKFWRYLDPKFPGYNSGYDMRYQDAIKVVYQRLDKILGELVNILGDRSTYVLLSDHGAGPNYGVMYINRWLLEEGFLVLRRSLPTFMKSLLAKSNAISRIYNLVARIGLGTLAQLVSKPTRNKILNSFISFDDIDWKRTKAYARGSFGQIFVNLNGREPQGIVAPGENYQQLVNEIMDKLGSLRHPETGDALISDIHPKEELYHGPYLDRAADVMFSIRDYQYQSSVKFGLESKSIIGPSEYEDSGSHRPEGVLVMAGPGIRRGATMDNASVLDIMPTLLTLRGLSIPSGLDGRPLSEAFTDDQKARIHVEQEDYSENSERGFEPTLESPELGDEELAQLEERLRSLGYLG
jgi:predicted AlkP superfamily phosphohydrolase/phosphomutase